jgi:energy-coupling factor transporter ATP-binding protein EcfA2
MTNIAALAPTRTATGDDTAGQPQLPRAPRSIDETGLARDLLADLAAKYLFRRGRSSLRNVADLFRLPPSVTGEILGFLRAERFVVLIGNAGLELDAEFQLTESGWRFASEAMARSQYAGPAPVSLGAYCERVASHSLRHQKVDATYVRRVFGGMVIAPEIIDELGAAMNSGRAVLIYGPGGAGKTHLAEHLRSLQPGHIPVPYAITVGGEIIQVFDPLIHEPVAAPEDAGRNLVRSDRDVRWQWCGRPLVIAGGELTLQMLDLQFDPATRYYQAPPHIKANGGIFVVDDLGRQLVAARDLMNRWTVPLDRSVDYLSLHTGFKFAIPFEMKVIFSTNLRPADIADESFLRRFGYKIRLGALDQASYRRIFEMACEELGVAFDSGGFEWLVQARHRRERRPLLACYPRDLIGRVRDFALYEGKPARAVTVALARAWSAYFTTRDRSQAIDLSNTQEGEVR